ncbi:Hypothetical protein (Fragment) [Durusdinium trenchii]|uniref:DDE-1 domain-containing protein n=1 Tax=Durusdinium trenchii TaxID=1381693 RepID=A0ABP0LNY7_9DINO
MKDKHPEIRTVTTRNRELQSSKWLNSDNLNDWFDALKKMAIRNGFARERLQSESSEVGEFVWKYSGRVIITDETSISSGNSEVAKLGQGKVVTTADRVTGISKRRPPGPVKDCQYRITMVGGHNLLGEPTVPVWIVGQIGEPTEATVGKIKKAVKEAIPEIKINNETVTEPIVEFHPRGGIAEDNIMTMVDAIELMFPDVADEPGKRVLWMTDWHGSRLSLPLLRRLVEQGIYLHLWLPNTTAYMQSPDVALFSPFKQRMASIQMQELLADSKTGVDRARKISWAAKAYIETFTKERCLQGARVTGVMPVNREALLNLAETKEGNEIAATIKAHLGVQALEQLQQGHGTLEHRTLDIPRTATDDFKDAADTSFRKLLRSPKTAKSRDFIDRGTLQETQGVVDNVISRIDKACEDADAHLLKAQERITKEAESAEKLLKSKIAELKEGIEQVRNDKQAALASSVAVFKSEKCTFRRLKEEIREHQRLLASLPDDPEDSHQGARKLRSVLATCQETLWTVENAPRDDVGLPQRSDELLTIKRPELHPHPQLSNVVMNRFLDEVVRCTVDKVAPKRPRANKKTSQKPTKKRKGRTTQEDQSKQRETGPTEEAYATLQPSASQETRATQESNTTQEIEDSEEENQEDDVGEFDGINMKAGAIARTLGCDLTSPRMLKFFEREAEKRKAAREEKESQARLKAAKKQKEMDELPGKIAAAKAKIHEIMSEHEDFSVRGLATPAREYLRLTPIFVW